ncbi:TetR/AcrR family transcriptional regulator [Mumia sp. zg.B53]|uniref:TetR/AcrR family transcriptional regulator n=1 Tax=unclassified Mumia TaxID=2621872 RepID=UPI001C6E2551|nr:MULTISPECIES: TetR/AcrR family transcriptional regulator [unclassified Mumia]MBW9204967.1 TetR/AcrR family transcriptional regulator [Mumia sp. zg.B17]MBW9209028.1 TetR/AcrR family transcriptional regulator [Mumia sp. zg.B21]MBW9213639.1 TetR/AcrR family transcriptional regulator [Mumia sp. zg.B53]MDD9348739.1 TetR/AcrR family transcriptional regulator [Mumia sp.]
MASPRPREELLEKAIAVFVARGVGGTSLRTLAAEMGTSHRMLIYHFGSREDLLAAVVSHLWHSQQAVLDALTGADPADPRGNAWRMWEVMAAGSAITPLVFELSAPAMKDAAWTQSFREGTAAWVRQISAHLVAYGESPERAEELARAGIAVVRGALWELAITGDRAAADLAVRTVLDETWPGR